MSLEDGIHCLIMDFCDGGELAKQIRRTRRKHQRIPEELVLRWFTQAMMSLKYIHGKHILHRDLKPGSVWAKEMLGRAKGFDYWNSLVCSSLRST